MTGQQQQQQYHINACDISGIVSSTSCTNVERDEEDDMNFQCSFCLTVEAGKVKTPYRLLLRHD
jgi:hypothetical protein